MEFAPYCDRSTSLPVSSKVGRYWNSICTTSGAPLPALRAVRSLVYSGAPWPALTSLTLMLGCDCSKRLISLWMLGTHVQKVSVTGPLVGADVVPPHAARGARSSMSRLRTASLPMKRGVQRREEK